MADHTGVRHRRDGDRAELVFATAQGLNVASLGFLNELKEAVDALAGESGIRLVVVRGEGKVFLAGADIKAMAEYGPEAAQEMSELGHEVFGRLARLPQVTVARIHGAALGGGCELAMACDFRFALDKAPLGQPEVRLGLIPGWAGTMRLPRLVGLGTARRLLFTGESITGRRAAEIGLVDEAVESEAELDDRVAALHAALALSGPEAVAGLKRALADGDEVARFAECFGREEGKEGMRAFLDKRKAAWTAGF